MPELCADELVVGGGVGWSYDRRRRRGLLSAASASAASDRMREHWRFFLVLQGSDTSPVISSGPLASKS